MKKNNENFYEAVSSEIEKIVSTTTQSEKVNIHATVRQLRLKRNMSGVELCRRAGDLDPRTLTALEKGRIKNPSIRTLQSIARGLGLTVSDLFRESEIGIDRHFYLGSQKGVYNIDFPAFGIKMVSFTPFIKDFFCGKLILGARKKLDQTILKHPLPIFVSVLIGKVEIQVEEKQLLLKEGENLFFNGLLKHSFYNPQERESIMLVVTSPSFV